MASMVYNEFLRAMAANDIDWDSADIRARLVMTNTTCDTEDSGIVTLSNFTTIDPCDATGYTVPSSDFDMASLAVNKDDANSRVELDAGDLTFSSLGGDASRNYQGVLLYVYVDGTNANDKAVAYIDFTSPITSAATQVTVPWDTEGIIQLNYT